jgi:hypothetical protein
MTLELILMAAAALIALVALLVSPVVRAVCWDAFAHPRSCCHWTREGRRMRELKAGIDFPAEG